MSLTSIGLLNTVATAAGLLGALASPWVVNRVATGTLAIVFSGVLALVCAAVSFSTSWQMIAVLLGIGVLLHPASNSALIGYQMALTPESMQGRVAGAAGFMHTSIRPLGPLAGGLLLDLCGAQLALLTFAVTIATATIVIAVNRSVRGILTPNRWAHTETRDSAL